MKKYKSISIIIFTFSIVLLLAACSVNNDDQTEWLSPTVSVSIPGENRASVFTGTLPIEIPNNDFRRENRGRIVVEPPVEGQPLAMAQFTSDELIAGGAIRLTTNLSYGGSREHNVRFRFRVDRFQGHSITQYALGAVEGVLILWQDDDGIWWNIRRVGWGSEFAGGTNESGVFTFEINRETANNFASQDFYLIFLEEVPFRTNAQGQATDYMSGYVITYQAESPDADGHFHNFNVLASTSIYIHVPPSN